MKLLIRKVSEVIVCDCCQPSKSNWTEFGPGKIPSRCFKVTPIEIAEDFVERDEFDKRVEITRRGSPLTIRTRSSSICIRWLRIR